MVQSFPFFPSMSTINEKLSFGVLEGTYFFYLLPYLWKQFTLVMVIAKLYVKHLIFACNAIFSGGLAGLSMMWYRSSSIALYLASKISEVRIKEFLPVVSFLRL